MKEPSKEESLQDFPTAVTTAGSISYPTRQKQVMQNIGYNLVNVNSANVNAYQSLLSYLSRNCTVDLTCKNPWTLSR